MKTHVRGNQQHRVGEGKLAVRGQSALNTSSLSFVPLQLHPTLLGSLESRFRLACQLAQMSPQARASLFCCVAQSRLYQIPVLRTLMTEV
jgi:hypothetical protein